MLDVRRARAEVAAVQDALRPLSDPLFKQEQRAPRAVVGRDEGDAHAVRAGHLGHRLEVQIDHPARVYAQLLAHQVSRHPAAVDWAVPPGGCQARVVVAVEVAEEVGPAAVDRPVAERVHADGEAGQDLVEGARPLVRLLAAGGRLVGGGRSPCRVLRVGSHHLGEGRQPVHLDGKGVPLRRPRDGRALGPVQLGILCRRSIPICLIPIGSPVQTVVDMHRGLLEDVSRTIADV